MFKVISGRTYNAIMKEAKDIKADILVLQQNREADKLKIAEQQEELVVRGNRISLLVSQNDACKSMRDDLRKKYDQAITDLSAERNENQKLTTEKRQLNKQIESLKVDLSKQGNELVVKSDELKKLNSKLIETTNERNIAATSLEECKDKMQLAYDNGQTNHKATDALIEGINAAMAEMRKVNRGKPSHNKSRAFQHLEKAMAAYNAAQPKTNEA